MNLNALTYRSDCFRIENYETTCVCGEKAETGFLIFDREDGDIIEKMVLLCPKCAKNKRNKPEKKTNTNNRKRVKEVLHPKSKEVVNGVFS